MYKVMIADNDMLSGIERILKGILENRICLDDELIGLYQEQIDIDLNHGIYLVATMEIDNLYQKNFNASDIVKLKLRVLNIINESVSENGKSIAFCGPEDRIILALELSSEADWKQYYLDIFNKIYVCVKNECDITLSIGIGSAVTGLRSIRDSYLESIDALRYKFVEGSGKVLVYSKIKSGLIKPYFYSNEISSKLNLYLRTNNYNQIISEVNGIFNNIKREKLMIESIYINILGLEAICLSYIAEMGENIEDILGKDFSPLRVMNSNMTIENSNQLILELFKKTILYFHSRKPSRSKKITELAKQMIDANYNDPELCLEKISKEMYLNSDYVRKVFKKELNMTITDYITEKRMGEARKLLDSRNMKLSKLSDEVGYSDVGYFSKCFKKFYGVSPKEYGNKHFHDMKHISAAGGKSSI